MANKYHYQRVSLIRQLNRLKQLPDFKVYLSKPSCLIAEGNVTPSVLAETYLLRIEYAANRTPKVSVKSPLLVPLTSGEKIPHMYCQSQLCLFLPGSGEWSSDMFIADTIVPWAALWLHYYELWHATGEWLGGGHEPENDKQYRKNRE